MYEWAPSASQPERLFACALGNVTPQLQAERGLFARASAALLAAAASPAGPAGAQPMASVFVLDVAFQAQGSWQVRF